jgi:TonB family protein
MKRSAILATLALTPALLVPAFAQTTANPSALQARLIEAKVPGTADTPSDTHPVRVFSGIVAPKLVHTSQVYSEIDWQWRTAGDFRTAVVAMTVDATGKPTDVKIVKSAGEDLDPNVLAAVSQYKFLPGRIDNQPTPVQVNLKVQVLSPLNY